MKNNFSKLLDFFIKSGLLKTIKRTGWVLKGIKEAESVADHCWRLALMAMVLGKEKGLDFQKMMAMALVHDLGEVETGDLRMEMGKKVIGSLEQKHKQERKVMRKLFEGLENKEYYFGLWEEFIEQKTKEAKFLKQVDKLEMAIQALEYEAAGYSRDLLEEFWENAEKYLLNQDLEELFLILKRKRNP